MTLEGKKMLNRELAAEWAKLRAFIGKHTEGGMLKIKDKNYLETVTKHRNRIRDLEEQIYNL